MTTTLAPGALHTRVRRLPDGRRVSVRFAVPSDAPRLAALSDAEPCGVVALDDHGDVVGRAGGGVATEIAPEWSDTALAALLERALDDPE